MRNLLKVVGFIFASCGAVVGLAGAWGLMDADSIASLLASLGAIERAEEWRSAFVATSAFYLSVGLLLVVGGIGISFARRWARLVWVGGLTTLAISELYSVFAHANAGTESLFEFGVYVAVGIFSVWLLFWSKLSTPFWANTQPVAPADAPSARG